MNELLFFLSILITFSSLCLVERHFSKEGLYSWVCFASVMANLTVVKTVNCFGMVTTLGNVLFGSVFLAIDILIEKYGKKEADRAVVLGLFANLAFVLVSQVVLWYKPSDVDLTHNAFKQVLSITPRVCLGSVSAYAFGNFLNSFIFDRLKAKQGGKGLWIRNNVSTIVSQFLDNVVLHTIAFLGLISFKDVLVLSLNVWIIEIIIAVCDTPFIYISRSKGLKSE